MYIPAQTLSRETLHTYKCQTQVTGPAISYPQQAICRYTKKQRCFSQNAVGYLSQLWAF